MSDSSRKKKIKSQKQSPSSPSMEQGNSQKSPASRGSSCASSRRSPVSRASSRKSPVSQASSRKSPVSRASSKSPPRMEIPTERYVLERNIRLSTASANPSVVTSPLPWDNQTYNAPSTPDSQIESTCAFEGSKPSTPEGLKRKKKKKMKKKSQRRTKSHIPELSAEDVQSSEENDFEVVVDKLERIYKSKSALRNEEFSNVNVNVRVMALSSSSDEEKEPSRTEYHIRTLNPKHNNFEMVSTAVQTDWSWLRDINKLEEHELDGADISEVRERIKYGLYGGFAPDRPVIVIKEDSSNVSQESLNESDVEVEDNTQKAAKKTKERKTKEKKQKSTQKSITKKLDPKNDLAKQRPVKSASKLRGENKPLRRIKSASAPRKGSLSIDKDGSDVDAVDSKKNAGQPEILKYHREKSAMQADLPSLEQLDDPYDLPPADGIFNGPCQFCGKPIMTVPPLEEFGDDNDLSELFCCPEYKHFIRLHLENFDYDDNLTEAELIDITPNAPYGIKQNRKIARERIAERLRERELERQRMATQQANIFTFARQMKTIQYSLASTKCMEEGWTVKPPTPSPTPSQKDAEIFHVQVNSTLLQKSEVLNHRFYENGQRFLTIFPDGTGCCYYPNGNVAVIITSTEKEKYTYIVQSAVDVNDLEDAGLLAVFEPGGNGICYYEKKQKIRLFLNPHGGIELDKHGKRRKRWQWYFVKGHVHAPPFQPLCFSLNKYLSVRVLDQNNIALIFASQKRSVRFNVGANLTVRGLEGHGNFTVDKSELYLTEKKKEVSNILKNFQNALRFPKSALSSRLSRKTNDKKILSPRDVLPPISNSDASVVVN